MHLRVASLRRLLVGGIAALLGLAVALAVVGAADGQAQGTKAPAKPQQHRVPTFELDPSWPKPLPNNWVFGGADSVATDKHGHVWVLSRPLSVPPAEIAAGRIPAPPVVELDREGNFVRGWGGPQWVQPWFRTEDPLPDYPIGTPPEHGIYVDDDDNVWLTGSGHIVLKFSRAGELLLQIGEFGRTGGSNDTELLGNPTDMAVDTRRNEVFVADGYLNRRVIVFDSETGEYKRHWGAYGNVPDDGPPALYEPGRPLPRQFFIVHGIQLSTDGLVYVSDRQRNRVQVFRRDGTFVREALVDETAPSGGGIVVTGPFTNPAVAAAGFGSVTRTAFSGDAAQRYLYAASLRGTIYILRRHDLATVGSFAAAGLHHIASDREGDIYISNGRTPQRWALTSPRATR
jgi:hypothetical protein